MRQSRVENEQYSVAYFNHVTAFKVLKICTSVKGRAHMRCVNASLCEASTQHIIMSPALNGNSEIQCFKRSDAIEIYNGSFFFTQDCHKCASRGRGLNSCNPLCFHSFLGKGIIELPPQEVFDSIRNPQLRFTYDSMLKVRVSCDVSTARGVCVSDVSLTVVAAGIAYCEAN